MPQPEFLPPRHAKRAPTYKAADRLLVLMIGLWLAAAVIGLTYWFMTR